MFYKDSCLEEIVEMDIDKIVAYYNHPFEYFGGQRLIDMMDEIARFGMRQPVKVHPVSHGKYEILDGHYRVAAARKLGWQKVWVVVDDDISEDEALEMLSIYNPVGLFYKLDIDIMDDQFRESEAYQKHKNDQFYSENDEYFTLGEYIDRFMLDNDPLSRLYISQFHMEYMGAPKQALNSMEDVCRAVAEEIVHQDAIKDNRRFPEHVIEDQGDKLTGDLKNSLVLIKKYLGVDLELFNYDEPEKWQEAAKIIFLFYMLRYRVFPDINILDLLKKPSMENIVTAMPLQATYNGHIIQYMLQEIRKGLPPYMIRIIENTIFEISICWDRDLWILYEALCQEAAEDLSSGIVCDYHFNETIQKLNAKPHFDVGNTGTYDLSPIATLYLKLIQHQYLGQVMDVMRINAIKIDSKYKVPPEQIYELRAMGRQRVKKEDIESYINGNTAKIANYIYGSDFTRNNIRDIRRNGKKVQTIIEFCLRARPFDILEDNVESALFVVSCLQAIMLDSKNETFDYTFSGYQRYKKHKSKVQGALKSDKHPMDALKIYWVRKVMEHWHANIGGDKLRNSFRKLENVTDQKRIEILSCSSLSGMQRLHDFYQNQLWS